MAITFKELNDKLINPPLTTEELELIKKAENYIDEKATKQFGSTYGISIDLSIPDFEYTTDNKRLDIKSARRKLMREELDRRYIEAGWNIKVEYDDGLDGPNMSGPDFWILNGKQ